MTEASWYEVVAGADIEQGDLIRACPTPVIGNPALPLTEGTSIDVGISDLDLVVLTQSCDLVNAKVEEVLLAEVIEWEAAKATGDSHFKSTEFRRALVQGNVPGYSLLNKSSVGIPMNWSIVDFHRLHVLSKPYLDSVVVGAGDRLRMLSPYREHLAQAFARYFMRVGLPHDAKEFVSEGK